MCSYEKMAKLGIKVHWRDKENKEPECPRCGFPMHVSKDICFACKDKEEKENV